MAKDVWALLGVFAAGFILLAGLTLGIYDRLDARYDRLDARIERLDMKLSGETGKIQADLAAIRGRLVRLETLVGVADRDLAPAVEDDADFNS